MIPKFSGPSTVVTPHARLLYSEFSSPQDAWNSFTDIHIAIDGLIESHPRLEKAHSDSYLIFFAGSPVTWVGREIIGHMPSWPSPFKSFDSYKGEAFEWLVESPEPSPSIEELLQWKEQLSSLAPGALAPTWRLKISSMECLSLESDDAVGQMPNISFQFFKSH